MELTLSTHLLVYRELDDAAFERVAAAGYGKVEAWLAEPHLPWRQETGPERVRERLAACGLRAGTVHLPFYPSVPELLERGRRWSVIDPDPSSRAEALEGARRGLAAAAALGAEGAVLHLGWQGDAWEGDAAPLAREAVATLLEAAREHGVTLLLENIMSAGTRAARLVEMLDELDPEGRAGICLDLGHAHVEGGGGAGILAEVEAALPRLRHLHVHDNDGCTDQHLVPGAGTLPWREVLERLKDADFGGEAALEIRDGERGRRAASEVLDDTLPRVGAFVERWRAEGLLP
jgi:sugar phosphate isomerase/epimerase